MSTEREQLELLEKDREVLIALHSALRAEDQENPSDEKKRRAKELIEVIAQHNRRIAELKRKLQPVELPRPSRAGEAARRRARAARWNTWIG